MPIAQSPLILPSPPGRVGMGVDSNAIRASSRRMAAGTGALRGRRGCGQSLSHDVGAVVGLDGLRQLPRVHVVSARHLQAKREPQRCPLYMPSHAPPAPATRGQQGPGMPPQDHRAQIVRDNRPDLQARTPGLR